jgi:hypothetical protein
LRIIFVFFKEGTKPADVAIHRRRFDEAFAAPDAIQKLVTAADAAKLPDEKDQELDFTETQIDWPVIHGDSLSPAVNTDSPEIENLDLDVLIIVRHKVGLFGCRSHFASSCFIPYRV